MDANSSTDGGQTPLIRAAISGHTEIAQILLAAGADPRSKDTRGLSAVDWAERRGFAELSQMLKDSPPRPSTTRPLNNAGEPVATPRTRESAPTVKQAPEGPAHTFERNNQLDPDSERSRRWVAGLRKRLGEEENRRIEAQNSISHAEENSPSDLLTVASDSNEGYAHYLKEEEGRLAEQSARAKLRLKSQLILEQSRERIETKLAGKSLEEPPGIVREIPEEHLPTAQLSASTESGTVTDLTTTPEPPPPVTESPTTGTLKRCPNCNAMYNSELLAYCALDATPLVDAESVPVGTVASQPPEVSNRNMLWVLVGVVLIGSASITLLITSFFATAEPVSTPVVETAAPAPPPPESNKPLVGGDLAGMELDVPLPNYPQNARDRGIKGDVTVRVRVNSRGRVISVRRSRGEGQLVRSALAAARKATFSPEKLSGKTVRGTITYSFK